MLHQPAKHLVERGQVRLVSGWVHLQVDNDNGHAIDDGLHEVLKACRASEKAHYAGDPLELAHAQDSERSV